MLKRRYMTPVLFESQHDKGNNQRTASASGTVCAPIIAHGIARYFEENIAQLHLDRRRTLYLSRF